MSDEDIIQGRATLDVTPFNTSLQKLDAAVETVVQQVTAQFSALDTALSDILRRQTQQLSEFARQLTSVGRAISGTAAPNAPVANASGVLTKDQLAAQRAAIAQQRADVAAAAVAQRAANAQLSADSRVRVQQIKADAAAATAAARQQLAAQQQTYAQQAQALRAANAAQRSLREQNLSVQRAAIQQEQALFQQQLAQQRAQGAQAEQELRARARVSIDESAYQSRRMAEDLRRANNPQEILKVREAYAQQARAVVTAYSTERKQIEQNLAEVRRLREERLAEARAAREVGQRAALQGTTYNVAQAEQAYRKAANAARLAEEQEASLQRQLTSVVEAERRAQSLAAERAYKVAADQQRQAFRSGAAGFREQIKQQFKDTIDDLKRVEDRLNSLYRAGSQLSSLGTTLTAFAGGVAALGYGLTNNAADFDFWAARLTASARAALTADEAQKSTIVTTENYRDAVLKLGRDLGVLKPEEAAKGWYLYQAALGQSIRTQQDFVASQNAVDAILRAAVISGTDATTAVKGVTQAMAEFGLQQEQAGYATAVMLNLTQTSQAEFSDVLEGFKMVGPLAKSLGIDLAETSGMMARMSDFGLKGSMAGRGLQMVLSRLLDVTGPADKALQKVFITNQGLEGSWKNVVFEGGQFIGLLDKLDQKGEVVQRGFLSRFAEATKDLTEAQRASYLAEIFPENAFRNILPLVEEYAYRLKTGAEVTKTGKAYADQLAVGFRNVNEQASLFGKQWETVAESVKVRLGQVTYRLQEQLVRLGLITADVFIPVLDWISRVIERFTEWGESHPELARGLIGIAAGTAAVAAVVGPLLMGLGLMLQGIAGVKLALATLGGVSKLGATITTNLIPAIAAIGAPILVLIGIVALLYLAWRNNWGGMTEVLDNVMVTLRTTFAALGDALGGFLTLFEGLFTGSSEMVNEGFRQIGVGLIEAVMVLAREIGPALGQVTSAVADWAGTSFSWLVDAMAIWGHNLMISLANGIADGAAAVWDAVTGVAEGIAQFFRSFSPPRYGPLMGIWTWGRNLIGSYIEGMSAADLSGIRDVANRMGEVLRANVEAGTFDVNLFSETLTAANSKLAEMVTIVRAGGRVNSSFFESLRAGLGEWYDGVVNIALAYQEVVAAQAALDGEKQRLELLKQQRAELAKQNQLRQDEFDRALRGTDEGSFESAGADIVDPTTSEGKAAIERMRRQLSQEEFQNWLNFQKRMWDAKTEAEDAPLKAQEEASALAVKALEDQLGLVKAQYDYYVAMFEYAQQQLELQKEEQQLREAQEQKAKAASGGLYGDPAQLEEYRRLIDGVVGPDTVIETEDQLRDRLKEAKEIIKGAAAQEASEKERLEELEKINREKRAQFEVELINAKTDAERDEIKKRKDAWDAAYKEEKAHLQERLELAKDVEEVVKRTYDAPETPAGASGRTTPGAFPDASPLGPITLPPPDWSQWKPPWLDQKDNPEAPRESKLEANKAFDDLMRALKYLADETVPWTAKLEEFGRAVQQVFGNPDWFNIDDAKRAIDWISQGMPGLWRLIGGEQLFTNAKSAWDGFTADLGLRWSTFWGGLSEGWGNFSADLQQRWDTFANNLKTGWEAVAGPVGQALAAFWKVLETIFFAIVGSAFLLYTTVKGTLDAFWATLLEWGQKLIDWAKPTVDAVLTKLGEVLTWLKTSWEAGVKVISDALAPVVDWIATNWGVGVALVTAALTTVSDWIAANWETGVKLISAGLEVVRTWIKDNWELGVALITAGLQTVNTWIAENWKKVWAPVLETFDTIKTIVETGLKVALDGLMEKLREFWRLLERLADLGRKVLGGDKPQTDGSHAGGLREVPRDGYVAELHRGERVLTRDEAGLYNSVEQAGLVGVLQNLQTLVGRATARAAASSSSTTNNSNTKTVVVQIGKIDASNPDEGRAFALKLAHLA